MPRTTLRAAAPLAAALAAVLAAGWVATTQLGTFLSNRAVAATPQAVLPASADEAVARLASSPRHGEWVTIRAGQDSLRSWVVYPERSDNAPVVIVIHEIFGLSNWIRGVADQLAADGFIAIAPDLLTMKGVPMTAAGESDPDSARSVIRTLDAADASRYLSAVAEWGMALPAAMQKYGVVGFCWGGGMSFTHAIHAPALGAAVVYYGSSPDVSQYGSIRAPVLGLYGGNDQRVNATVPPADSVMKALGKIFEPHTFDNAGHGFLRQQDGQAGANRAAAERAWPLTVAFFRRHLAG